MWQKYDFSSPCCTKIDISCLIFQIQWSSFGFIPHFVCSKNHFLQPILQPKFQINRYMRVGAIAIYARVNISKSQAADVFVIFPLPSLTLRPTLYRILFVCVCVCVLCVCVCEEPSLFRNQCMKVFEPILLQTIFYQGHLEVTYQNKVWYLKYLPTFQNLLNGNFVSPL